MNHKYLLSTLVSFVLLINSCTLNDPDQMANNTVSLTKIVLTTENTPEDIDDIIVILDTEKNGIIAESFDRQNGIEIFQIEEIPIGKQSITVDAYVNGKVSFSGSDIIQINENEENIFRITIGDEIDRDTIKIIKTNNPLKCDFFSDVKVTFNENNPLFTRSCSWNSATVIAPEVIYINGLYYLWFNGRGSDPFQIGLATSNDGINWNENENNPVMSFGNAGEFDESYIRQPNVIYNNGIFRMWYNGYDNSNKSSIGYAESVDGINWVKHENNPVISASEEKWVDIDIIVSSVLYHENKYHLWFKAKSSYFPQPSDKSARVSGYATSKDGLNWTIHPEPIHVSDVYEFEQTGNELAHVLLSENGYFETIYYGAITESYGTVYCIGRALSSNGIDWEKDKLSPIIIHGEYDEWNSMASSAPTVIRQGNKYQVWFAGYNGGSNWNIGQCELSVSYLCE